MVETINQKLYDVNPDNGIVNGPELSIIKAMSNLVSLISQYQYPLTSEKELQNQIAISLTENDIKYEREYGLQPHGIVDFMLNGIAIEVKIKGQKKAIYRQCREYCQHNDVTGLILLTSISMGLPDILNNKPTCVYSLSRAHL